MILFQNKLVPNHEVCISHLDRGYCFGDGIYEVFRVYHGQLFEAEGHYKRLVHSANETAIRLPVSLDELDRMLRELIEQEKLDSGTVYMQITRGVAPRTHAFPADAEPVLLAYATKAERPLEQMQRGITAMTTPDIRWLRCDLKTLNLLPNVMTKQKALQSGFGDAIWHRDGMVTECSSANLMLAKNGIILTHPANHLILHGITRGLVLRLAQAMEIPVQEQPVTLSDLYEADEIWMTGTTTEVTPIIEVDGKSVGSGIPGPVTRRLQERFEQYIKEQRL